MFRSARSLLALLAVALVASGCYALRRPDGGGLTEFSPPRAIDPRMWPCLPATGSSRSPAI